MNHDEAIRLKAAEKYLLGELSAELRDQYEDHYFGCAECAQDIRTGAVFIDNARDVLIPPSVTELGSKHQPVVLAAVGGRRCCGRHSRCRRLRYCSLSPDTRTR